MTAKKKKEDPQDIRVGDIAEYNGIKYKVTFLFGRKNEYATIEDRDNRWSVRTASLELVKRGAAE